MRRQYDVLRSVKKYLAEEVLGPTWEVRLWSDEGTFQTPLAKISPSAPALVTSRRVVADVVLPIQIHCYLEQADTTTAALTAADAVGEQIFQGVSVGLGLGFPMRIPLYDYAGLDDSQGSSTRYTYDFIKVLDLSLNNVQDADEPTIVVPVADMRLGWRRDTTVYDPNETVESVTVTQSAG